MEKIPKATEETANEIASNILLKFADAGNADNITLNYNQTERFNGKHEKAEQKNVTASFLDTDKIIEDEILKYKALYGIENYNSVLEEEKTVIQSGMSESEELSQRINKVGKGINDLNEEMSDFSSEIKESCERIHNDNIKFNAEMDAWNKKMDESYDSLKKGWEEVFYNEVERIKRKMENSFQVA